MKISLRAEKTVETAQFYGWKKLYPTEYLCVRTCALFCVFVRIFDDDKVI